MKRVEIVAALVWVAIGLAICAGAYSHGLGSLRRPQPGLFPFAIGAGMTILAVVHLLDRWRADATPAISWGAELWRGAGSARAILVLILLAAYALAFERLGFALSTVVLLIFMFRALGALAWRVAVPAGAIAAVLLFVIFEIGLKVNLPRGPLGF